MSYKIKTIPNFEKALKRLARKYPSLKAEYIELLNSLEADPMRGTPIGKNCFKIRLAITSKGKGKSGGARVVTYVLIEGNTVFLLDIYDKSKQENVTDAELTELLKEIK